MGVFKDIFYGSDYDYRQSQKSTFKSHEKINYAQTVTKHEGLFGFLGVGEEKQVKEQKTMSVVDFCNMTCDYINGKGENLDSIEFDQDSIINGLWSEGDLNQDGQVDKDEYRELVDKVLTGANCLIYHPEEWSDGQRVIPSYYEKPSRGYSYTEKEFEYLNKFLEESNGLDVDGDGYLSKEEYQKSPINYILTNKQ